MTTATDTKTVDLTIQGDIDRFEALRGTKRTHYDLARKCESEGFNVQLDSEDNERSRVLLPGAWHPDGSDIQLGEIIGDASAVIQ
jgi:hypothetical protein